MLPIVHQGALTFLESDHLRAGLGACCPLQFDNLETLTKLLSSVLHNNDRPTQDGGLQNEL